MRRDIYFQGKMNVFAKQMLDESKQVFYVRCRSSSLIIKWHSSVHNYQSLQSQLSKLCFNVAKIAQDVFCLLQLSHKHQIIQNLKRINFNVAKNSLNRPQEKQHENPIPCWFFYSFPVVKPILFNFQPTSANFRQLSPIQHQY